MPKAAYGWAGKGLTSISVVGLAEVLARAEPVRITDQITWQVVTLLGLVGLKLLAWDDRPEQRGKDGTDLRLILQHYYELITDDIFDHHYELLVALEDSADYDVMCLVGIQVLGQELGMLVGISPPLHERLRRILAAQIQLGTASQLAHAMAQAISPVDRTTPSISQAVQWLDALLAGL